MNGPLERSAQPAPDDPLCAFCGAVVPLMGAIIYHGVVYHPACVAPTTRPAPDASGEPAGRRAPPAPE